ncbi:centriolin-like isoform X6 [Mytilus trossulus]|uniref:centriolin-like isoform X6 n=1 Tax=Mytilus trossulus TaxID=6551 RepID=UPI003004DF7E
MKKTPSRGGQSNLPVPKTSRGSPGSSKSVLNGRGSHSRSSEDIPRHVQLSYGIGGTKSPQRRAISPGNEARFTVADQGQQSGVRYITEDLIRKIAKEDQIEMITNLNLTLAKEGGKKIKYIENLDKLKRLTVLNLSCNMIEKIEKMDKLFKLKELNLSYNNLTKIEGLESMTSLQVLNLTGNQIQHIPIWMGRKFRALRTLHIGKNNMESLSELAKLKPIPDLTQLTVAENPLSQLPHSRMYIIFHIRCLETLDSQNVTEQERQYAKDRFEQDEVERLEKQLEQEETKIKKLTADKNKSVQESSFLKGTEEEMKKRERMYMERMQEMEKELETKNGLLSKKTKELNKACEKHYQLEQELAFHKIDSKFDSLGKSPQRYHDDDDSGQLDESPYLGRARFKANQFSRDGSIGGSPGQKVTVHSFGESASPQRAQVIEQMATHLDQELSEKQDRVSKNPTVAATEERLKRLQDDMQKTETKLLQATKDLKRMGDIGDKDDVKVQVRQRLAKKMQLVNELKDSATQIEDEIQKTQNTVHKNKVDVARLKGQLDALDTKDPKYRKMYAEMVDKEQQISESNQMYGQLQTQLEVMLDTIAKETDDIKKLETQLNDDRIDANDNLRQELDEIVGGLQGYLANVKNQGMKRQRDYESVLGEKAVLQQKVGKLEQELAILDTEAKRFKEMEKRLGEMELTLQNQEDMNRSLEDQLHKTRHLDAEHQDRMENTHKELSDLKRQLKESEKRAQNERMVMESQMVAEKAKTQETSRQTHTLQAREEENRRLAQLLEQSKSTNAALKDQLSEERHKQNDSVPLGHLRKRLKDLSQTVKSGKSPISPLDDRDVLGKTFKDLQLHLQDKLNRSFRDNEDKRRNAEKTELEIQALKDNLKKAENKLARKNEKDKDKDSKLLADSKNNAEEVKRLTGELNKLKAKLKDTQERALQGKPVTRVVYRPESEDDRSSLNSEEKHLYDELQRELMDLRRGMRTKEKENTKRLTSAENEVAELNKALEDQEQQFEDELSRVKEEAELQREAAEARLHVIAQDLDQAQNTADHLGQILDDRDQHLQHELKNSDMNNQMISGYASKDVAQEMELSKLYEILEAQRDEIEHLNSLLDQLSMQNNGQGGPLVDDEMWKLRQDVNKLKETLAMQSAYIQTMPQLASSTGTQAHFDMASGPGSKPGVTQYHGQASGPLGRPGLSRHFGPPMSVPPNMPGRSAMGTSYAPPGGSVIPGAYGPPGGSVVPGAYGPTGGAAVSGGYGAGAENRGARTPPGVYPSDGRSRSGERYPTYGNPVKRTSGEAAEPDNQSARSGRSGRSGRGHSGRDKHRRSNSAPKTAFEPVHRPVAYNPVTGSTQTRAPPAPGINSFGSPTRGIVGASAPMGFSHSGVGPSAGHHPGGYGPGVGYGSTQTPGYAGTQTAGPTVGMMMPPGVPNYRPMTGAPAHTLGYKSGRAFLPAYSTSPERPAGRVYYQSSGGIPMPPPPPPPPPMPQYGSPGPRVSYLPVSPIASGTPLSRRSAMNEGSLTYPPSPIVAGSVDMSTGQPRGILKSPATGSDDSYLFCNVPEHHDLEDYIAELQDKVKRLKAKYLKNQAAQEEEEVDDEHRLIRRLRGELEERRDELEGLDLAIERQKKNLKDLRKEEKNLNHERQSAREELEFMSKEKRKRRPKIIVDDDSSDDSLSEGLKASRRNYLKDEINALERTLGKRRGQLKNADRLLKTCNTDLIDAREQAKDTVSKFDNAASGLETTVKEKDELERRANLAALDLIKAQEQLGGIRSELRDIERKRNKQDRLLRDVNQVINKRDGEYKDVDGRVRAATENLRRLHDEINSATQREKDTLSALRDAEDVLGKRRSDIQRMRDQIESQKRELEKVDQLMGKKRTELHLLQDTAERKQSELASVLREADAEATAKQRELRELKEYLRDLESQKNDLISHMKTKRNELNKLKEAVETEDEVLQKLVSSVNKHKTELKHTYEMQRLENGELDSLKTQHAQKLAELERTQRELTEEKSELEQLNAETSRKSAEVERLRQALDRDRQEVERLTLEKQSLEDRVAAMNRERDLLDDSCKDMDNKMIMMKRNHQALEEKIEVTSRRSEKLEIELRQREKEMDEANHQRTALQKEVQQLKLACKECRSEVKSLKENIRDSDDRYESLQTDLKDTYMKRDEAKLEYERLNEGIRQSRLAHDDYLRQEKSKQLELQDLLKNVNNKQLEYQETKMALNKVRKDVEREEKKLNHKESKALQMNEEKFIEMEKIMKDLEREILSRNEEKNELSKALSRSYEELQKHRTNSTQENEKNTRERLNLENKIHDLKNQLEAANQLLVGNCMLKSFEKCIKSKERKTMSKRANSQVTELQSLAEEHFNRANRLDGELSRIRKDRKDIKRQLLTQNEIRQKEQELEDKLRHLQKLQTALHSPRSNGFADTTDDSNKHTDDKDDLDIHLENLKQNFPQVISENKENIQTDLRGKLTEEQDYLRYQLQQQMKRHADAMETARLQSEGTIESLRDKLNTLQEVLVNTGDSSDDQRRSTRTRTRSSSPGKSVLDTAMILDRNRSPSPGQSQRSYSAQRHRSRSTDRAPSPLFPDRELLTA